MHAEDITKITLNEDIAAVRSEIVKALETNNVVVVAHSYGTLPSTAALEGLDTASRTVAGNKTSVTGFLIIAGLLISPGYSLHGLSRGEPVPAHDRQGPLLYPRDPPGPGYLFYHDLPLIEAKECCESLKPQSWAVHETVLPHGGHLFVPTRYMVCLKDNILPEVVQMMMVNKANEDLKEKWAEREVAVDRVDSSHSPFLSKPEVVGDWIRKYGGKEEGIKLDLS